MRGAEFYNLASLGENSQILNHIGMKFDIITIFPKIFSAKGGYLDESILKRAQKNKLIEIKVHNLRDFTKDKHRKVDDRPFGGGPGMVIKIQPLVRAVEFLKSKIKSQKSKVILFSSTGKKFDNKMAAQVAKKYDNLILICGRYEGIDARLKKVIENCKLPARPGKIENLSIGDYVLTGGEIPAMVLIDSVSRQIPGVLGRQESLEEKRGMLGAAVYTRPEIFEYKGKKYKVPKILLSGDHKKIEEWRKNAS